MTPELHKSQAALEQLADLTKTLEKEKVQLTPEVEEYVREHVRAVQDKLQAGQDVYESDLEFIPKVKMWVEAIRRKISLKQWLDLLHVAKAREKNIDWIDKTFQFPGGGKVKAEEEWRISIPHKPRRSVVKGLYLTGCTGLTSLPEGLEVGGGLYLAGCTGLTKLPEGLKIDGDLDLRGCTGLTELLEGLSVGGYLNLINCTGLTKLPEGLSVGRDLWLSEDSQEQVKKDAERLQSEGKIGGEIKYR